MIAVLTHEEGPLKNAAPARQSQTHTHSIPEKNKEKRLTSSLQHICELLSPDI